MIERTVLPDGGSKEQTFYVSYTILLRVQKSDVKKLNTDR